MKEDYIRLLLLALIVPIGIRKFEKRLANQKKQRNLIENGIYPFPLNIDLDIALQILALVLFLEL